MTPIANIVRAFNVFDATVLDGQKYGACALHMGISQTRVYQLARLAHSILSHPSCAWADDPAEDREMCRHRLDIKRARHHKEFWRRRLAIARALLRPCDSHKADACPSCKVHPSIYLSLNSARGVRGARVAP